MSVQKNGLGEIFRILHSLISLGHKLREQSSEKLGNSVIVAFMLRDSVNLNQQVPKLLNHASQI